MSSVYKRVIGLVAWVPLVASWICLASASRSFVGAVKVYGFLDIKPYLGAELAFYGLFAFGLAATAVLVAIKGDMKSNLMLFRFFKITLFVSAFLLAPMLVAMLSFLISQ